MLITTKHPLGSKKLTFLTLDRDYDTGQIGYKIGYCSCGCLESVIIPTSEIINILTTWKYLLDNPQGTIYNKIKRHLIIKLGGKV